MSPGPFSGVERTHVEVAVLGPVEIRGNAAPFRRRAAGELVVYLALHREGVGHMRWPLALWPHRPVSAATVHSTASDARRALGRSPSGTPLLGRGPLLRLSDEVETDVEGFARLAASGHAEGLCRALALVRGPVLAGLRRPDWAVLEGIQSALEHLVVRTALSVAPLLTEAGRPDRAAWAVRRALLACPYDEQLFRALLAATAAGGNRAALGSTMAELLARAEEAHAVFGAPSRRLRASALVSALHPETTALYRVLAGRPPATGARPARL